MGNTFKQAAWKAAKAGKTPREMIWGRNERQDGACPSMVDVGGFLDGTMADKPSRRAMEEHLAECAVCRGEIVDVYLLLRAPRVPTPPDLMQRLLNLQPDCAGGECPAMP